MFYCAKCEVFGGKYTKTWQLLELPNRILKLKFTGKINRAFSVMCQTLNANWFMKLAHRVLGTKISLQSRFKSPS